MRINWRDPVWYLDLLGADSTPLALAMPLVTGADLLAQYAYLNLGFALVVGTISSDRKTPQNRSGDYQSPLRCYGVIMSQNWMRHFELLLLDKDGKGIKLSDLKVTFQIQKMPATIFNGFVGNFKIYNLSKIRRIAS
jgi:hypothetical protein